METRVNAEHTVEICEVIERDEHNWSIILKRGNNELYLGQVTKESPLFNIEDKVSGVIESHRLHNVVFTLLGAREVTTARMALTLIS
ncbi:MULTISPECIES: hypothetical protein [Shewanella]|uniref:hypothetical protein n=1 Tax=Shewanella TaxID=22 RepID=UPI0014316DBE|nr:hypothetical protein [Shewanella sp. Iso12]NJI82861.1 hypothetical protein [Shewanella sp. Iso12]